MSLLADYNMPFAAALVLMVLIALFQAFGLGHRFGDTDLDAHADGGKASIARAENDDARNRAARSPSRRRSRGEARP